MQARTRARSARRFRLLRGVVAAMIALLSARQAWAAQSAFVSSPDRSAVIAFRSPSAACEYLHSKDTNPLGSSQPVAGVKSIPYATAIKVLGSVSYPCPTANVTLRRILVNGVEFFVLPPNLKTQRPL
jgi:hypothetical protein